MAEYEKKVRKLLAQYDCVFVRRGKGDHDIWYSPITKWHITVDTKINMPRQKMSLLKNPCIILLQRKRHAPQKPWLCCARLVYHLIIISSLAGPFETILIGTSSSFSMNSM